VEASPLELARALEKFLVDHPHAVLLDDGRALFDLSRASYSLATEHGRCVLHLWSEERNLVRTIVGLEERKQKLRLRVRRLGAGKPQSLDLVPDGERRTPATRTLARTGYLRLLERVLTREFNGFKIHNLRSAMDLEHSFGPAYARGMIMRGQHCWAVIGVGAGETKTSIDGVLTLGILWLAYCREHGAGKTVCQGLKVFVPKGEASTTRARMAWLNPHLGAWELYELCESSEELTPVDASDQGNLEMRLVHSFDPRAAVERAKSGLDRVMRLLPETMRDRVAIRAKGPGEVSLSLHGLEFARVRHVFLPNSFIREDSVTFGVGPNETPLRAENEAWFLDLLERLFTYRSPTASAGNPLFRLQPEAWLEATLREDVSRIEPILRSSILYSQVPAFAGRDRGMLDLLTITQGARLAVLELKADEDLQLPLQGLDYWIRVRWLNQQREGQDGTGGELERSGYFPGIALLPQAPLLYYVVPALRVHPSMETVLRHFAPSIDWRLIAINEAWRTEPKVIFRKRSGEAAGADPPHSSQNKA
jgi:hypothetical protein